MTRAAGPPLRVWAYAAGFLAAGAAALAVAPPDATHSTAGVMNLERLSAPAATPPPQRVVAVGSSKLLYAVSFDENFMAQMPSNGTAASFVRITYLSAEAADIAPALIALARNPPDVLLVEADLLTFDRTRPPLLNALHRARSAIGHLLPVIDEDALQLALNERQNHGAETFYAAKDCAARSAPEGRAAYAARNRWRHTSNPEVDAMYLGWLRRYAAAGTRVILLDIPRAPWASALFPPALDAAGRTYLAQLEAHEGFAVWHADPIGAEGFCDEGHMTAAGRSEYERWLIPRLAMTLERAHVHE